jgi:hypothetical protein
MCEIKAGMVLVQVNDIKFPYVKVISVESEIVFHKHLGHPRRGTGEVHKQWFRKLTKKEVLEVAVTYDY